MFLANQHPVYKEGYNAYMDSDKPTQSDNKYEMGLSDNSISSSSNIKQAVHRDELVVFLIY